MDPGIRLLAADLRLAANTVARACPEMESQGPVHSRVWRRTMVTARRAVLCLAEIRRRPFRMITVRERGSAPRPTEQLW